MFRVLEDQTDCGAQCFSVILVPENILPVVEHAPGCRAEKSVEELDKRGFAGTRVANQAYKLVVRYFQIHIFESRRLHGSTLLINEAHIFQFDSHR